MRRHRIHPVIVFLLVLVFGPYLLALAAVLAVLWLAAMALALVLSGGPRR